MKYEQTGLNAPLSLVVVVVGGGGGGGGGAAAAAAAAAAAGSGHQSFQPCGVLNEI